MFRRLLKLFYIHYTSFFHSKLISFFFCLMASFGHYSGFFFSSALHCTRPGPSYSTVSLTPPPPPTEALAAVSHAAAVCLTRVEGAAAAGASPFGAAYRHRKERINALYRELAALEPRGDRACP